MKKAFILFLAIIQIISLSACGATETSASDDLKAEIEASPFAKTLSTMDVMTYVTAAYPGYNTFVLIENTVHVMNCLDAVNRTELELAREISSITDSSYEAVSVQQLEDENRFVSRRIDYIAIEDSDGVWNHSTNYIVSDLQKAVDDLAGFYDQHEVIVRENIPGVTDYIGKQDATVTELMGCVDSSIYGGFMRLSTDDNQQVFIFPNDTFECQYNEGSLEIRIWETTNPSAVSPYEREIVDIAMSSFMDTKFYLPGYKELFPDELTEEMAHFHDSSISVRDFNRLVNGAAIAYTANGITAAEYEARMQSVQSIFDHALNNLFVNTEGIQIEITHDYAQTPAVIVLSEEPYFSLFARETKQLFAKTEQQTADILSTFVVEPTPDMNEAPAANPGNAMTPEAFVQSMLYGDLNSEGGESLYNMFVDYELFYGPQTPEQLRSVLEGYKGLIEETVYVDFGNSYDHAELEAVVQTAHTEMEAWWVEYVDKTGT